MPTKTSDIDDAASRIARAIEGESKSNMPQPVTLNVTDGTPQKTAGWVWASRGDHQVQVIASMGIGDLSAATPTTPITIWAYPPNPGEPNQPYFGICITYDSVSGSRAPVVMATAYLDNTGTPIASGTVTSVALSMPSIFSVSGSPITSSGTFSVSLATQSANTVFAGPTSGGAATPTFRSLVAGDIPSLSATYANVALSNLSGATSDMLAQYLLLAGRASGQTAYGGAAASENLTLNSTAHVTKGIVLIGGSTLRIDEALTTTGIKGAAISAQAQTIYAGADANKGLQIRQNSASQSGKLIELTNSTGATQLAAFNSNGQLEIGSQATFASMLNAKAQLTSSSAFTGTGLDDATFGGTYTGQQTATFDVVIDATGTPDTFKWRKNAGSFFTGVAITGAAQTLTEGVTVTFAATTGHTLNDQWTRTLTIITNGTFRDSAANIKAQLGNDGSMALGIALIEGRQLQISRSITDAPTTQIGFATALNITATNKNDAFTHQVFSAGSSLSIASGKTLTRLITYVGGPTISAANAGTITTLDGLLSQLTLTSGAAGAVGTYNGINASLSNTGATTVAFTTINQIVIGAITTSSLNGATIGTARGLLINDISGATTNYAIQTFSGNIVFNESADGATDVRMEAVGLPNLYFLDSSAGSIGINTSTPSALTYLDVVGTTKSSRPAPGMTTAQRDALATPPDGALVYNTDSHRLTAYYNDGWVELDDILDWLAL